MQDQHYSDEEVEATDGELPIGDMKGGAGNDINNYTQPNIPVQGALERLIATKD